MARGLIIFALWCSACAILVVRPVAAQTKASSPIVGPGAVWNPTPEAIAGVRKKCGAGDPLKISDCFYLEMQAAGASPEAIAFAKSFAPKGIGYLRAFRETGRVDIAYVEYVFRANEMDGVFFVNGDPPWINVDDDKNISQEQLGGNSTMVALKKQYPHLSIWPGDRFDTKLPVASTPPGGQNFIVEYLLQDGCHACARVGTTQLSFVFDAGGKFQKTELVSVSPSRAGADHQ